MDDLRISLSDAQASFVERQVASGGYTNASAYVGALIDATARELAQRRLETLLLQGLEGTATEWTPADADALVRLAAADR